MQSISLVILAAGLGSRYGGQKQTDGLGPNQESLLDYAIYDGLKAGFTQIVFVVRESMMPSFKEALEARWGRYKNKYYPKAYFECVLQKMDDLPEGCERPVERTKPWGTAHALWAARECIHEPFAMINADDFYGCDALLCIAQHLKGLENDSLHACLVGYPITHTLSKNGSVSRGICEIRRGNLRRIVERTHIETDGASIWCKENGSVQLLDGTEIVSMNLMGFSSAIFTVLEELLTHFFHRTNTGDKSSESSRRNAIFPVPFSPVSNEVFRFRYSRVILSGLELPIRMMHLLFVVHCSIWYKMGLTQRPFGCNKLCQLKKKSSSELIHVVRSFIPEILVSELEVQQLGLGHIHRNYLIQQSGTSNWILQRINTLVFTKPKQVEENHLALIHLFKGESIDTLGIQLPEVVPYSAQSLYYWDADHQPWRLYTFYGEHFCYEYCPSLEIARELVKHWSVFTNCLIKLRITLRMSRKSMIQKEWRLFQKNFAL